MLKVVILTVKRNRLQKFNEKFEKEMIEDVETLAEGMRLLQYDYIGGSGSRGYGIIAFENIIAETVVGDVSEELLAQCNKILSQAIQE